MDEVRYNKLKITHDLVIRLKVAAEAERFGISVGTNEWWVFQQIRWYETDGSHGFCFAGERRIAIDVGFGDTPEGEKLVKYAIERLQKKNALIHTKYQNEEGDSYRIRRNKTSMFATPMWFEERGLKPTDYTILRDGKLPQKMLDNPFRNKA